MSNKEGLGTVIGSILDAHSAYLLIRGLKTLPLRMARHNASASHIAQWLQDHPKVAQVFYPGLASHPDHAVATAQMTGFGGVVSFRIQGVWTPALGL